MYKLFLTLRYLRKRRIAYFAIAAVTLCTAMVLIVMSVMGGFLDQLKVKARGLLGDVIMDNRSYGGFPLYDEFIADISEWRDPNSGQRLIAKATPVIYSYGILRIYGAERTKPVSVVGLRLEDVYDVNAFRNSLFYEKFYPGTTTLADQQQPRIGFDPNQPVFDPLDTGEPNSVGCPSLPPEYEAALAGAWAAGARDTESTYSIEDELWNDLRAKAGRPPLVGCYEVRRSSDGPMAGIVIGPPVLAGDPLPGLIIGREIIAERQSDGRYLRFSDVPRGAEVTLSLLPETRGKIELSPPILKPFRYTDDSRTGIYEIDSQHVYCDFALLQQLLRMNAYERIDPETGEKTGQTSPGRCSQIQIKIGPGVNPQEIADRLTAYYRGLINDARFTDRLSHSERRMLAYVEGTTWEQSQAHIIAPVEKERQLVTILFGIISLVAAVLVLCILYMIVLQKTRDIGIVKSIGGSSAGVALIFVTYGLAVGLVGSTLGAVIGYYFVRLINEFQDWLTRLNPAWQVWDRSVYSFDAIPNTVRPEDIVAVFIVAIVMSMFGSVAAAWRAGAMEPVEALRHE